jgi:hypothetical protein
MADFQMGVGDKSGGGLLFAQPNEELVNQCRLSGTYFAREKHKALAGLNSICQLVQSLLGLGREEQIARVRIDVKGIFPQPEEMFVHVCVARNIQLFSSALP